MLKVKRTERGWAGHFICAHRCQFRRNTLLECGETRIVVSTVGAMRGFKDDEGYETIGADRNFETMAFHAEWDGTYWDMKSGAEIGFDSPWAIAELEHGTDQKANDMHEAVVDELTKKLMQGHQTMNEEHIEIDGINGENMLDRVKVSVEDLRKAGYHKINPNFLDEAAELLMLRALLHTKEMHPEYEYATTHGPRKAFDEHPPQGEGWERNTDKGRDGWERFDYHEEAYWKRKTPEQEF